MIILCAWHTLYWGVNNVYSNTVDLRWRKMTPEIIEIVAKQGTSITHGLCPDCFERLDKEIELENRREEFLNGGNSG